MSHVHLKASNGCIFFLNLSHKRQGADRVLWIRVNLAIDWYILLSPHHVVLTHLRNRFSYICSNIAPSLSSCPTSFLISNCLPVYQWVSFMRWLMFSFHYIDMHFKSPMYEHTSGSKRTEPQQDALIFMSHHIWLTSLSERWHQSTNGIKTGRWGIHINVVNDMATELEQVVCIILVAILCNKPAAHKMGGGGVVLHSDNNICSLCWILVIDKGKPSAFKYGGASFFFFTRVCTVIHYSILSSNEQGTPSTQQDLSTASHSQHMGKLCDVTRYCKLSCLCLNKLLSTRCITSSLVSSTLPYLLFHADSRQTSSFVKTHFYRIWVQHKILRPNHKLIAFHSILADVMFFLSFLLMLKCGF